MTIRANVRRADGQETEHTFGDDRAAYAAGMASIWRVNGATVALSVHHSSCACPDCRPAHVVMIGAAL